MGILRELMGFHTVCAAELQSSTNDPSVVADYFREYLVFTWFVLLENALHGVTALQLLWETDPIFWYRRSAQPVNGIDLDSQFDLWINRIQLKSFVKMSFWFGWGQFNGQFNYWCKLNYFGTIIFFKLNLVWKLRKSSFPLENTWISFFFKYVWIHGFECASHLLVRLV